MEELAIRLLIAVAVIMAIGWTWRNEGALRSAARNVRIVALNPRRHSRAVTTYRVDRKPRERRRS
jgi:hypothetical protein